MDQDALIENFVSYLSGLRKILIRVTEWPDKTNRNSADIDAIAIGANISIGIEHTSIDTVSNQRLDSARFMKVFGNLESELEGKFEGRVTVIVHFYVLKEGQDWSELRNSVTAWLKNNLAELPYSSGKYQVANVPFELRISKRRSSKARLLVGRFDPEDETIQERLKHLIRRKVKKLEIYRKRGYETVLLIESDDIALGEIHSISSSIAGALAGNQAPPGGSIWVADTSIPSELLFQKAWPV